MYAKNVLNFKFKLFTGGEQIPFFLNLCTPNRCRPQTKFFGFYCFLFHGKSLFDVSVKQTFLCVVLSRNMCCLFDFCYVAHTKIEIVLETECLSFSICIMRKIQWKIKRITKIQRPSSKCDIRTMTHFCLCISMQHRWNFKHQAEICFMCSSMWHSQPAITLKLNQINHGLAGTSCVALLDFQKLWCKYRSTIEIQVSFGFEWLHPFSCKFGPSVHTLHGMRKC